MVVETSGLTEFAVLLPATDKPDSFGRPQIGPKEEVPARWELSKSLSGSNQQKTKPVVGLVFVDRPVPVGSILWRGRLLAWPGTSENLYEVVADETIVDIKGQDTEYTVAITNFKKALPQSV